jgi:hypothetical protein
LWRAGWGNIDVDPGTTCYYGVNSKRSAYKYCSRIQGYTGALLMISTQASLPGIGQIADDFSKCRYLTHTSPYNIANLIQNRNWLQNDGQTDGGCRRGGVWGDIPDKEDKQGVCPAGGLVEEYEATVGVLAAIVFVLVLLVACSCVCLCRTRGWLCFKSRGRAEPTRHSATASV